MSFGLRRRFWGLNVSLVEPTHIDPVVAGESVPMRDLAEVIERVRILCTVYDPREGRYRLDYALFVEILAGVSILGATAWYLAAEWRHQRTARPS